MIRRWQINDEVATFIGTAIVVALMITVVNGVLLQGLLAGASAVFQPQNANTRPGDPASVAVAENGAGNSAQFGSQTGAYKYIVVSVNKFGNT